ncbi:hypothetical protein J6P92_00280 [bacterium]|nr:hypothetical protein [bacterium]
MSVVPSAEETKVFASGVKEFIEAIKNHFVVKGSKMSFRTPNGKNCEIVCDEIKPEGVSFSRTVKVGDRSVVGYYTYNNDESAHLLSIVENSPRGFINHDKKIIQTRDSIKGPEYYEYVGSANKPLVGRDEDKTILTPNQVKSFVNYVRTGNMTV